jgi:cytochrome c peroxidase
MKIRFASRTAIRPTITLAIALAGLLVVPQARADLTSLRRAPVPLPANLGDFVANRGAAIQLGKAFFWDMQTGGDGVQACASCHFQAGADTRTRNILNPGANGVFDTAVPDAMLTPANFPIDNGDVAGSQGVIKRSFLALLGPADSCTTVPDPVFNFHGVNVRQVTGRNTPSTVNAIFNFRSFWDGRANNVFNGVNPAGPTDPNAAVLKVGAGGVPVAVKVQLPNASLASQAVGPPNNGVEMSCSGRRFPELGRKLLNLVPLGEQLVHPSDSVLGSLARAPNRGLSTTYGALIQAAFKPAWWNSGAIVDGFSVMENNFSLYWGLSLMLYESTLVSDDTRVDRLLDGNRGALTAEEQLGMNVFTGKGRCDQCHGKAELTMATVSEASGDPLKGFFNTGVRPIADDAGDILQGNGFFKTPGLRNVELNGPYFHNGDKATLRQVVDFYDRGGDFRTRLTNGQVRPLGLSAGEKNALVAFMVALTDDRVRFEKAPFDHPSLDVPNGPNLPAVGAGGRSTPLGTFLGMNPFQP